jgi:hypothetical protein
MAIRKQLTEPHTIGFICLCTIIMIVVLEL